MNVFVTGSHGFIGRRIVAALQAAGHDVTCGVSPGRTAVLDACRRVVVVDFTRDFDAAQWMPRLAGVQCVVNAVGVIASATDIRAIHVTAPKALFAACAALDIQVVNISALGADAEAMTTFHLTKREADDALLALSAKATVVQPSLVYGSGGASARLFTVMATLPVIPLPGAGTQRVQPIHVDDLAAAVVALVGAPRYAGRKIPLVGPAAVTLREFLAQLRAAMGLRAARFLPVPLALAAAGAAIAGMMRSSLLNRDTWQMLNRGNTADVAATRSLLGRSPRPVTAFIDAQQRDDVARSAKVIWLAGLMRIAVAIVWLVAGVVSAGLYPVADSLALIARMGIADNAFALLLLYAGVAVDLAFAVATLIVRRKAMWLLQIAVVVGYTIIISIWLPEFWLHPYGPIVKNLPFVCALLMLHEFEER